MTQPPDLIDVGDATFDREVIEASHAKPVVVDFWAAWCGPCRALGPMLEEVAARSPGVTLAKLDVDANPQTAARFGIRGIPAVKAFSGGQVTAEFVGLQPRPAVDAFFARLLPPAPEEPAPEDESGLRDLLARHPGRRDARRALGRLLLCEARVDEADAVLAEAPDDAVSDGLRARIALLEDASPLLPAVLARPNGVDELGLVPDLIAALRGAGGAERSQLRRVALGVLAAHEAGSGEVERLRRELASALF